MNLNIKLDRRKFMELLGVATVVAALPAMPVVAEGKAVTFPAATGSWGTVAHSFVGGEVFANGSVTLAEHTVPVYFRLIGEEWHNISDIVFPAFTKSCYIDSVTVEISGQRHECRLDVAHAVEFNDVASFSSGHLNISSE